MQRWKTDPTLRDCPREEQGHQKKKLMNYEDVYIEEFLNQDPMRDWESIDRCRYLWNWCMTTLYNKWPHELPKTWKILDIGTKDGQFPQWLRETGHEQAMGTEISGPYVDYAKEKGRPVVWGDVCNMDVSWTDNFDFVFAHHVLGLTPDYMKALEEMYRVTNKYMVALNQVPGNKQKHYSYIGSPDIFYEFVENNPCEVIWNDYLETGFKNEYVIFVRKCI
jgi:SAM-dependent methyltransferase